MFVKVDRPGYGSEVLRKTVDGSDRCFDGLSSGHLQ